jgi:hypothetical protein
MRANGVSSRLVCLLRFNVQARMRAYSPPFLIFGRRGAGIPLAPATPDGRRFLGDQDARPHPHLAGGKALAFELVIEGLGEVVCLTKLGDIERGYRRQAPRRLALLPHPLGRDL